MFDFDRMIDRKHTESAKWQKYKGRDVIPMWVADMDFLSPPAVVEALHSRVAHGIFGYGIPGPALVETVTDYLHQTYQWQVQTDWIVWLPGLVTGLNVTCRSIGTSGDQVLTTVPVYPPFLSAPKNSDRRLVTSRMSLSNQLWQWDLADLEAQMDDRTRLFILCNPHNPTGRVFSRAELMALAQICLKHNLVICSDEIHCDLVLESGRHHLPLASLDPEIARHTVTLMAPSKTYNIPGLSCSYAIISNDRLRRAFKRAMAGIVPHVNVLGLAAAQAAYALGQPWLHELKRYLLENRDVTFDAVRRMPGLSMAPVEATYLAWIDARELSVANPAKWFEAAGVGLSDGAEFDGAGFVRLNFGCPRPQLTHALERMEQALSQLPIAKV